jgi:predicted phosphodiesterase
MGNYTDFIPENIALANMRRIGIYDTNGNRVGQIPLGSLTPPDTRSRWYCFGVLSDVHIGNDTASDDFAAALTHLSGETDFVCISGDLIHNNSTDQPTEYKRIVDSYAKVPVYACTGNHDAGYFYPIESNVESYTGRPLYYSITHGNDVFIFVGVKGNNVGTLFTQAELQWLYETLEQNRNKRCFVFQHVRPDDSCGNALGIYKNDIWGGTDQTVFESLLRHYKNIVLFHGHSHLKFDLQKYDDAANIGKMFGCWSVHVPSISVPRGTDSVVNPSRTELYSESEGYVVDVYENGIHLRGRDFVKGQFLPIASYWLDTTLQTIPAGTYTDSTGTITT